MKVLFNKTVFSTILPQRFQKQGEIDGRNIERVTDNPKTGGRIITMRNGTRHSVLSMPLIYR